MQLTKVQQESAQAIVQVFETGKLGTKKAYSVVTLLRGDTGGLTYGKHQTTINSGNLYLLIKAYTETAGALYATQFVPYMALLAKKAPLLASNTAFKKLLADAGTDPVMQKAQDDFFDRVFWEPAVKTATAYGFTRPLSAAIIYDSMIHGSWGMIRDRTNNAVGAPKSINEVTWIQAYNNTRRSWLANHSNKLLRNCVYRQDALKALMAAGEWDLSPPFTVRGVKVTLEALGITDSVEEPTPLIVDAVPEDDNDRLLLFIKDDWMRGDDVKELQTALVARKYLPNDPKSMDGIYGPATYKAVMAFQAAVKITVDGIVGNNTRTRLGID